MKQMSRRAPIGSELVNILLGVWLALSPFVLGFTRNTAGEWSNLAAGIALVFVALLSGWGDEAFQGLVVPLGVWIFASPFVVGFSTVAFLANNESMAFVVIAAGAITDGLRTPEASETSPSAPKS